MILTLDIVVYILMYRLPFYIIIDYTGTGVMNIKIWSIFGQLVDGTHNPQSTIFFQVP